VIGKEWQPPTLQDVGAGIWCSRCRQRHPYNGKNKLLSRYTFHEDGSPAALQWLCPNLFDVVGVMELGRKDE
jgi:hypothetical protein